MLKDRNGYLYPASGQASSVLDALREELALQGAAVITECGPVHIEAPEGPAEKWKVTCDRGTFFSDALILAAGSKAAPATGSDGSGYKLARKLGHRIITPLPALVQLRCREPFFKQIAGVRTEAQVKILAEGEELASDCGELQMTDYGISGIPVFQVSRFAARALYEKKQVAAVLDFYPEMGKRRRAVSSERGENFSQGGERRAF